MPRIFIALKKSNASAGFQPRTLVPIARTLTTTPPHRLVEFNIRTISWTVGTGGKARPGRDADHSPPSSAEVVNE
jgi:hypothetical protein